MPHKLPTSVLAIWAVLILLVLVAIGYGIRAERRRFAARGKYAPWLILRLGSVPILAVTAAAVMLPARTVGGPEALGVFYLALFTIAPAVYFGLHWFIGRFLRPRLTNGESAWIGFSGLAIVLGPLLFASMAQPWVFMAARGVEAARTALASEAPLPHRVAARQRLLFPEVGIVWTEHWQAPAGVSVERIEINPAGQSGKPAGGMLCRSGADAHIVWPVSAPSPKFRMYWVNADGKLHQSDWSATPPEGEPMPFTLQWKDNGFVLPVRLPRNAVALGRTQPNGELSFDLLNLLQPGESFADDCLPLDYRRVNAASERRIDAFMFIMYDGASQEMRRAVLKRPTAEVPAPGDGTQATGDQVPEK